MYSGQPVKQQVWLVNPFVDCIFLLNPVFLYLFFAVTITSGYIKPVLFVSVASMLFSYGHTISPIFVMARNLNIRQKVKSIAPHYVQCCLTLFALPILAYGFAVYLFFSTNDLKTAHIPIITVAGFYALWSLWHTMSQQFGILRIYKGKCGMVEKSDRTYDLIFCFLSLYLIVGFKGWSDHADLQMSFYNVLNLKSSAEINYVLWLFPAGMLLYVLLYMFYQRVGSLAVFLSYMGIIALASSVIFYPPNNVQLLYSPVHWIQAIFLASLTTSKTIKVENKTSVPWLNLLKNFILLIGLGYLFVLLRQDDFFSTHRILSNGQFQGLENLTTTQFFYVALFFSLFIGLDFVHFYLDRLVYKSDARTL